jgi:hypothetical protein
MLSRHCHGDDRPDCPILEGLEKALPPAGSRRSPDSARKKKAVFGKP